MRLLQTLWRGNPPLTAAGLAMLPIFLLAVLGLFLDPRLAMGAPVWLKPAKFAISLGIYDLTLAWIYGRVTIARRTMRGMAWITVAMTIVEMLAICIQAARGTTSHYNISTPVDIAIFAGMGIAIAFAWIASLVMAVVLIRQRFDNRVLGNAVRCGLVLTVLGSASGGMMLRPTRWNVAGAHTVGAPDGGPGMPLTNWSRGHGDLRIPHFLGLHGIQAIPLLGLWLVRRRIAETLANRIVWVATLSYLALYVILLTQAWRGEPIHL